MTAEQKEIVRRFLYASNVKDVRWVIRMVKATDFTKYRALYPLIGDHPERAVNFNLKEPKDALDLKPKQ
tara:strand:+ start:1011 stop:1217 length:207 start_codon:yes stop_codon:yes gene_type:complete